VCALTVQFGRTIVPLNVGFDDDTETVPITPGVRQATLADTDDLRNAESLVVVWRPVRGLTGALMHDIKEYPVFTCMICVFVSIVIVALILLCGGVPEIH